MNDKKKPGWLARTKAVMLAMRVSPNGHDQPLPPLPPVEIDPEDDSEQKLWDKLMPKYRGLLRAQVKGKRRYEE